MSGRDTTKPQEDAKIKLPRIDTSQNKLPPPAIKPGGKGSSKDEENLMLGQDKDEQSDQEILDRVRKRFDRCIQANSENRKRELDDIKFWNGDQWPADIASQRNQDQRPCLTINTLPVLVNQITNDQRQNRPTIDVSPVGDKTDKEAAKMYRGLIRAIERECAADIAYDTAFSYAVGCGRGYWRILTKYESPKSFRQAIVIERIRNIFTVYLDPDHKEPDGADCRFGFITDMVPRPEFKETWPKATETPFAPGTTGDQNKEWADKDRIRVAEYFEIEHKDRTWVLLENGHEGWEDELKPGHSPIAQKRKSQEPKVMWYKVTSLEILERREWLGQWIPIIPVIGNELDIEGKVTYWGIIRHAKDPQRMYNYWATAETELIALAPKAPFIVEEGQIEGHEQEWKNANRRSRPYLSYKGTSVGGSPAPPPQRQPFAGVPAGVVGAKEGAAKDLMSTTGVRGQMNPDGQGPDYRESGKMLREQRRYTDLGAFHLMDNLARSLKHCGRQLIDLIPKIYDERQIVTILREDDEEETVELNPNAPKAYAETKNREGKLNKVFNPSMGKYGITVTIGPSFATKRIEAAESMMEFAKFMPNTAQLVADLIAKYQDWPGAEEMATRLAKAVPAQLMTPDQKDMSPQVQAIIQNLQQQVQQLGGQLQQAMQALQSKEADREIAREKIMADFEAKVLATVQKADAEHQRLIGDEIRGLAEEIRAAIVTPPAKAGQGNKE